METKLRHFSAGMIAIGAVILILAFVLPAKHASLVQAGLVMASLGISFQIVFGLLGQLSLGHSALFGVGAYAYAYLTVHGAAPLLALLAACGAGAVTGLAVAAITARLGGAYFAVVTYALATVISVIVSSSVTLGQTEGLLGVASLRLIGLKMRSTEQLIYAGACFVIIMLGFYALWRSRLGSMLEAVRANTTLAGSLGINAPLATIVATGISGLLAGLVGAIFAQGARFVSPDVFLLYYIVTPLAAVAVGGTRALFGALLGSIVVVVIPLALSINPIMNQVISGLLLTVFVIAFPAGLAGLPYLFRRRKTAEDDIRSMITLDIPERPQAKPAADGPALVASNVSVRYGGVKAVTDFSLSLGRREIVGLIGPNGAGKSSLVNALTGAVRMAGGSVAIAGEDVTALPAYKRIRQGLSRTFQNTSLIDTLSVISSVRLARSKGRYGRFVGQEDESEIQAVVKACGLSDLQQKKVGDLSYMHRRLTAIAMVLVMDPIVVFLDEATAGLTAEERGQIGRLITEVARRWGTSFLVIEHDVEFVVSIADRICVMTEGRFLKEGKPDDVLREPEVIMSYLGSSWNVAETA